ncbi:glycosyltransferase family 1 protein [Dysgonomonas sp. 216]|uniref:glycosyltransferase n=1 Tax=Dysgonomonas sp. 216 TaxID=2302934 RepID=UPI0013D4C654|nr:glycosyltransferase [Dysgonomonas sp. 216]NDW19242.1 glycosyltransferase family 1 protein [Dysgonomonas sp. 216]
MIKIKEINMFTTGDSSDLKVFSNVPYFFAEGLLAKDIKVNRINIAHSSFIDFLYRHTFLRILKACKKGTSYTYFRSKIYDRTVARKIKKAERRFPDADINLFMTFSFSSYKVSKKPVVLFGDWTYDHYITHFKGREPDYFEKKVLLRENSCIENSNMIFVLFPGVYQKMKSVYNNENIYYLGNVINSLELPVGININKNKENKRLLFVGKPDYKEGALQLIECFSRLRKAYPELKLDIIGMSESNFNSLPSGVLCHGYLDKGKSKDKELFYKLLKEATVFINTTPKWGAFSATLEAMYFYTPVIVTHYKEFVETFGENIDFGVYYTHNENIDLYNIVEQVLESPNYELMALNAYDKVKDFTWDNYITKFLSTIEDNLK